MAIEIGFPAPYLLTHGNSVILVQPNHDRDTIYYSEQARLPQNEVRVVFGTAPGVTWWKGLEVRDENGNVLRGLYTENQQHGPIEEVVNLDGHDPYRLSLMLLKAKAFGAHTEMYRVAPLGEKAGKTLYIQWETD